MEGVQLEQTMPSSRNVNTTGMSKVEARRIQMLVRQRERLEDELQALRTEVDDLVRLVCMLSGCAPSHLCIQELSSMKKR